MDALLIAGAGGAVALVAWFVAQRRVKVPCELDLEATEGHFHAHAVLEGALVQEGDEVLVHDAPRSIPLGEVRTVSTTATVTHVSWPRRLLVRVLGTSQVTDLYEVGFEG